MKAEESKRFHDLWRGDADFRQEFLDQPGAARRKWGLPPTVSGLHHFCVEQKAQGNLLLVGLDEQPGMEAYRALNREKHLWLKNLYAYEFSNQAFNSWRLRQISRFRTQVPDDWADRNPHLPFIVELTNGCSLSCPFCAGAAQPLDQNIPAFEEHQAFFAGLIGRLQQKVGLRQAPGVLYFFTEPFDHPEYERYLAAAARIWGMVPQTTTAAWFRDEGRTRRLMKLTEELGMTYNRFSVNSKKRFQQCLDTYSPRELLNIQLVLNYPEAAGAPLYASGRGRQMDNTIQGSVACVSGFLVNLPLRRIQLVSPTLELQRWPSGCRVLEEASIATLGDLELFLQHCHETRFNSVLHGRSPLVLRSDLQLKQEENRWFLANTYRRIPLIETEKNIIELLAKVETVDDLLGYDIAGMSSGQVFTRLQIWWANGLLED
jgi:hypothetical protein